MFSGKKPLKPLVEGRSESLSDDQIYWDRLKEISVFQETGNISSTDFLPVEPFHFASTCSNRLTVYNTSVCEPLSVYSRFKVPVYAASYRTDGSLLGTATHDGHVHFYDVYEYKKSASRNPIRSFHNAHNCRINALAYDSSMLRFASMADDGVLKLWDLAEDGSKKSQSIWQCQAHEDHIRSGAFSRSNNHLLLTGSYDHSIRAWDTRVNPSNSSPLVGMDHGAPVEKILLFSNDTIVVSAGGNKIKLWDICAGGKLLHSIESHYKTITSMCFASNNTCILTGGLDRRVNVFRCNSGDFSLIKSWKAAAPILTLSMSQNDQFMVYGMSNLLSIHKRKPEEEVFNGVPTVEGPYCEVPLFVNFFKNNTPKKISSMNVKQKERGVEGAIVVELTARQLDKMNLGAMDNLLRLKRYRELVSTMMSKELPCTHPEVVVSAFQQLRIRQKLHLALSGHSEEELLPLLDFLCLNLFKSTFFDVLHDVVNVFITIYAEELVSIKIVQSLKTLHNKVLQEIELQKQMCKSLGTLDLLSRTTTGSERTECIPHIVNFKGVPEVVWSLSKT